MIYRFVNVSQEFLSISSLLMDVSAQQEELSSIFATALHSANQIAAETSCQPTSLAAIAAPTVVKRKRLI